MIKFNAKNSGLLLGEKIKVSNLLRWNEDLGRLENCLFCDTLSKEPLWAHYCMDILYIAIDSIGVDYRLSLVKDYIVQNYNREFYICEIAKQVGYTTPYMINKFKLCYGVTPKAYLSQIRIQKAKELLLTTDKFSREISDIVGFSDELYFIRFFKKHTGITPRRFRERGL